MAPMIRIQLLGGFSITCDGQELLPGRSNTRLALLLAFLLLKRNLLLSRKQIAYLFWTDSTDKQARSNLRGLLTTLRREAPMLATCLLDDKTLLGWHSDPTQEIDVTDFESALERAAMLDQEANNELVVDTLKKALSLYTGDLLPASYADWVLAERLRLKTAYLDGLHWLIDLLETLGRHHEAIHYAEQLWRADPLRETTIFLLMRLYAAVGDRARALSLYADSARLLVEELGVEPGPAIQELHQRLLQEPELHRAEKAADRADDEAACSLIGRTEQWEKLVASWRAASAGAAHIVMLTGEAGIGKSYLAHKLRQWCSAQGATVLPATCPQARLPAPYVALAPLLASQLLAQRIERMDEADVACLQALSAALRRRYALNRPEPLAAQWQQLRLLQALTTLLTDPAEPTLITLDDAQWCDEQSFEWLNYLFAVEPTARLMVVMMVGEGDFAEMPFQRACAAFLAKGHLQPIELNRLTFEESARLARHVASQPLDQRTVEQLYAASAGNPFFIIELVRMLETSQGVAQGLLTEGTLPASVSALILHRLSTLSPTARRLLDVAAVIGQHFTPMLLFQADRAPSDALVQALDELWRCALIVAAGADVYTFSHELVREVIYRGLSDARRRHLHRRVAQAMVELSTGDRQEMFTDEDNRIATHFALADRIPEAAHFQTQ
ncbi:BTAD domain-containing putative transcriptional regulator [Caldilinea sp.]|jgi:DNA-binding SARP family transcriptional activator|uniref:ATP-binding protein n=1 Tax=Caldilinea sp. TaxID=2293560 RepID=UPI001B03D2F9|nr:BTAD domain-containing putative transcriptional regulator [Caldilinea sp.]MBO9394437.1 AAA family ATPase [Caldilinea sp.]